MSTTQAISCQKEDVVFFIGFMWDFGMKFYTLQSTISIFIVLSFSFSVLSTCHYFHFSMLASVTLQCISCNAGILLVINPTYCRRSWAWQTWPVSRPARHCCTPSSAARTTLPPAGPSACSSSSMTYAGLWSTPDCPEVCTPAWMTWLDSRRHSSQSGWVAHR